MATKQYVRLADHLTRGMRADLNSGFSISGYNVVEMPDKDDEPDQYKYVKGEISAGRLEIASKAEYDETHPDLYDELGVEVERPLAQVSAGPPVQETQIQRAARKGARAVRASREEEDDDAVERDEERRKATLKAQKAQASGKPSKKARRAAQEAEEAAAAVQAEQEDADAEGGAPSEDAALSRQRHQ